jgi:hypothetical protein
MRNIHKVAFVAGKAWHHKNMWAGILPQILTPHGFKKAFCIRPFQTCFSKSPCHPLTSTAALESHAQLAPLKKSPTVRYSHQASPLIISTSSLLAYIRNGKYPPVFSSTRAYSSPIHTLRYLFPVHSHSPFTPRPPYIPPCPNLQSSESI